MHLTSLIRHLPRRASLLAMVAVFALGVGLPATALAAPATASAPCNVQCAIAFGNQRIDDRQAALTKLHDHIADQLAKGHITSDQSNALQSDVSTNQSGLSALKTKLDAETDVTAAKQDVHNIYFQFRIFAVVLPRDYGELALDVMANLNAKMTGGESKIQTAIDNAPDSEKAQLNALFSDYKAQLGTASNEIGAAESQVPQLTPDNFNNNRSSYLSTLAAYKNDRHAARAALKKAAQDLHQIATILKGNKSSSPTATPAA
jgi:septal ring factor EnvC (AmiA/AmiB activator)